MSFELSWKDGALKDLEKLDILLMKRIVKKIVEFAQSGSFHGIKRMYNSNNMYRLRVGYYRVIFEMNGNTIVILKVGHRKNIY